MLIRARVKDFELRIIEIDKKILDHNKVTFIFDFQDDIPNLYEYKTLRIVNIDEKTFQEVLFKGNRAENVVLPKNTWYEIGIFIGENSYTTTTARFYTDRTILSDGGIPEPPTEDVYAQILEQLNRVDIKASSADVNARKAKQNADSALEYAESAFESAEDAERLATSALEEVTSKVADVEVDGVSVVDENHIAHLTSSGGGGNVDDVKINGTSIVDANKIANIPIANIPSGTTSGNLGVVKLKNYTGLRLVDGVLAVKEASSSDINNRRSPSAENGGVLTPDKIDEIVKTAMCDGVGEEWTDEEKASARERLDIQSGSEVFTAIYGITTKAQITEAIENGKIVVCSFQNGTWEDFTLPYISISNNGDRYVFSGYGGDAFRQCCVNDSGWWENSFATLSRWGGQENAGKVYMVDSDGYVRLNPIPHRMVRGQGGSIGDTTVSLSVYPVVGRRFRKVRLVMDCTETQAFTDRHLTLKILLDDSIFNEYGFSEIPIEYDGSTPTFFELIGDISEGYINCTFRKYENEIMVEEKHYCKQVEKELTDSNYIDSIFLSRGSYLTEVLPNLTYRAWGGDEVI